MNPLADLDGALMAAVGARVGIRDPAQVAGPHYGMTVADLRAVIEEVIGALGGLANREFEAKLTEAERRLADLAREREDLLARAERAEGELPKARERSALAEADLAGAREELAHVRDELLRSEGRVRELEPLRDSAREIAALRSERDRLQKEGAEMRDRLAGLETAGDERAQKIEQLAKRVRELEELIEVLRCELDYAELVEEHDFDALASRAGLAAKNTADPGQRARIGEIRARLGEAKTRYRELLDAVYRGRGTIEVLAALGKVSAVTHEHRLDLEAAAGA